MSTTDDTSTHADTDTSLYLSGNYAPVTEEVTAFDLPVIGELPAELNGRYLRNGPNPMGDVDPATHHWFMGDGMIHGIRLREGEAEWYRNRYVGSAGVQTLRGQPDISGPNWNDSPHGPNTNVGGFAGTTWAMVEAGGCPVELTYELDTVGRNDFFGTLPGAFTAHPKVDPDTGEMHAMVYAWGQWLDHIQYVVVGRDGRVNRTVDIPLGMTMLHDMSLTGRYAVVYDQPVTVDIDLAFAGRFPFRWTPDYGNRIGLLPRDGQADDIIWVDIPIGYAFHPLNSYDTPDGKVVIDICNYPKMFDADILGPFGDRAMAKLERWEIDPVARSVSVTVIDETSNEFPRHRGSLTAKPYRYGYCASPSLDGAAGWPTIKHDLQTGDRRVFDHGPGRAAGEPAFVARPDGTEEDDGWLVTYVHDLGRNSAEFVVLDAADFDRGYVARVPLPQRVPFGFHGNWVSDRSVPEPG
ncbi:MAG: carotenoid oxygenase family protein [Ilumatobacter fluminis]|uniref:carotenoid oxygenase family protein n=1 Tax=Ilumatobacter fluminis TaxID=467091 RepID=UPI0032EC9CA9